MKSDYVSEVYASVQGEGPFTGEKQVFLRLAGCPLRCDYCDTPQSLTAQGHSQLTIGETKERILSESKKSGATTVSVTGGEPLAHGPFLQELLPLLKKENLKIYLETAGVHYEALVAVINFVDVIAMDMKLPSATGKDYWAEHKKFLTIGGSKIFVKIVVENHSLENELAKALELLKAQQPTPVLILQPVTAQSGKITTPLPEKIAAFYAQARASVSQVFVMPQQHKIWGAR